MDLKERIELLRQTADCIEVVVDNDGKVPDGYLCEIRGFRSEVWEPIDWSPHFGGVSPADPERFMFYRLVPKPAPTIQSDLIRPGWFAFDREGTPCWFSSRPEGRRGGWACDGIMEFIQPNTIILPDCDWKDNLRRIVPVGQH